MLWDSWLNKQQAICVFADHLKKSGKLHSVTDNRHEDDYIMACCLQNNILMVRT